MEVTRTSLRAQRNQQIPKQVSQGQTQQKGGYGEELKQQLQTLGDINRKRTVIKAKRVDPIVSPTEQYTQDAVKTAMEKLKKFVLSQGLGGDTSGATEQTTPFAGGGGGGNRPDFFTGLTNDQLGLLSTQQLVDRDNEMYGDTFPEGSFSPTDTGAMVNRDKMLYGDTFPKGSFNITPPTLAEKQSQKTYEQNRLKEGEKFADRGEREAVNASGFQQKNVRGSGNPNNTGKDESARPRQTVAALPSDYKETEAKAFLDAKAYQALKDSGLDKTVSGEDAQVNVGSGSLGSFGLGTAGKGAPSGASLPSGSFGSGSVKTIQASPTSKVDTNISRHSPGTSKDQPSTTKPKTTTTTFGGAVDVAKSLKNIKAKQEAPKQTVASLPSNYKSTEAAAFAKAKSYKDSKAKGDAAAKATNTPTKPKAGSFGISAEGKKTAEANKAEKKKATPAQKTAIKKSTTVKKSSPSTTKSSPSTSKSGSKRSSRGAKSGGSKSGGSKSGGSKSGGSKSGGSKSAGSKKSSRGAKGSSSSRSKGGTSKGTSRRSNTRRSRRRCDIRCKFDISILTNQNLIRDDLADVAYFVKDLQEIN